MNLLFCGDIMPGGVLPYQDNYISSELLDYLNSFDFRIGTLEAAIGTNMPFDSVKEKGRQNIIYARDEDFFRVKEMGLDVVSLANNHVCDLGKDGLKNTISILEKNGVKHCGAGMNVEEASIPAIIEKDGLKVAVLAYCMSEMKYMGYVELAGKDNYGVNALDIDKAETDIKEAKRKCDVVVVLPHWGREYQYEPLVECVSMARKMIKAGADAVFGTHTHQIQPFVEYKGKPICFSMGNFLFPDFYMYPPRPIWYPESVEKYKGVKEIVGYPFPINEPIKQVWNPVSRYGCVVELNLDSQSVNYKIQHVCLSDDNVLSLFNMDLPFDHELRKASRVFTDPIVYVKRKHRKLVGDLYHRLKKFKQE